MATAESTMQAIANRAQPTPHMGAFDPNDTAMVQYLGLNPADPKSRAVVAVCRTYGLDPLLKHVIVIPKGGVYITRDGYLHIAHRSGQYDGMSVTKPVLDEAGTHWEAEATCYRKDMSHPFVYWGRYPITGSNREYAQEMAVKCAESHALRRAFNVTGLGAADERFADDRYAVMDIEAEAEHVQSTSDE